MLKFDNTVNFALFIGLSAIFTPMLSTWIIRKYDYKLKKIELQKDFLDNSYSKVIESLQDFVINSGKILSRIDSSQQPSRDEIQNFEASCLKCLLFLEENERNQFQEFRILVKLRFGHSDPRGKRSTIFSKTSTRTLNQLQSALGIIPEDEVYSAFNKCITIAVTKLKTLELQQNKTLTEEKFLRRAFDQIAHLLKRQKH